jgi:hypothetical protein
MTRFMFLNWLNHFLKHVDERYGVLPTNRHLLLMSTIAI